MLEWIYYKYKHEEKICRASLSFPTGLVLQVAVILMIKGVCLSLKIITWYMTRVKWSGNRELHSNLGEIRNVLCFNEWGRLRLKGWNDIAGATQFSILPTLSVVGDLCAQVWLFYNVQSKAVFLTSVLWESHATNLMHFEKKMILLTIMLILIIKWWKHAKYI